jgi:NADPH-dependent 2,4-dienoyl-CoA reductase/sulfur reductase-like enzyme
MKMSAAASLPPPARHLHGWLHGRTLVELPRAPGEPNTRATTIELYDGLEASSQNRWPSLEFDLMAVNSLFAPLLRRLLLQDLQWLPGKVYNRSSAAPPASVAPAIADPTPTGLPSATCW